MFFCRLAKQHCMQRQLMRRKSGFFALCLWPPAEMLGFNFPLDLVLETSSMFGRDKKKGFQGKEPTAVHCLLSSQRRAAKTQLFWREMQQLSPKILPQVVDVIGCDYGCKSEATFGKEKKRAIEFSTILHQKLFPLLFFFKQNLTAEINLFPKRLSESLGCRQLPTSGGWMWAILMQPTTQEENFTGEIHNSVTYWRKKILTCKNRMIRE